MSVGEGGSSEGTGPGPRVARRSWGSAVERQTAGEVPQHRKDHEEDEDDAAAALVADELGEGKVVLAKDELLHRHAWGGREWRPGQLSFRLDVRLGVCSALPSQSALEGSQGVMRAGGAAKESRGMMAQRRGRTPRAPAACTNWEMTTMAIPAVTQVAFTASRLGSSCLPASLSFSMRRLAVPTVRMPGGRRRWAGTV